MEVSIRDLLNVYNPNIIDIRSMEKYNDNHMPGSINIPSNILMSNYSRYLNKMETYYVYCQKGITSLKVVQFLRALGYRCYSVSGGYEAYILSK